MGQAFPLLMDQIIQGQIIAREDHYHFIMAQKAEKTLHYVRPKNCRQSPKAKTLIGNVGKGKNFLSTSGGNVWDKTLLFCQKFCHVCFIEEDTNFCVNLPDSQNSQMKTLSSG